ncbi:MAG: 23S rRNA (adenine(2503)-C(2))-methyltransferase RlmN [Vicinamibacteria bacterium]|nr:23S rRNA (adenine(2503)-C(2))-methyltransferase RlmN [Vicinamibacteria bacterium]
MDARPNLFGLDRAGLEAVLRELGQPRYRAGQVYGWLYAHRVKAIAEMTDLGKGLRDALAARFDLRWPEVSHRERGADGTVKFLFRVNAGEGQPASTIESVFIPDERRNTICISTQAGCPLACTFCLTGIAGYRRNLAVDEILGQVATVMDEAPRDGKAWNIVVMGMGEPLLNEAATFPALRVLMDPKGFAIPPRKLTLSTVGILPALERLAQEPVRPNLAISLHAPNPELRRKLMPIEEKYALHDVLDAAERYPVPRGGRATLEYALLAGVNDQPEHARELAALIAGRPFKVNLIPLNPAPEIPFAAPGERAIDRFCAILVERGVTVSVRRSRGQDVLAACGQLHLKQGEALAIRRRTPPAPPAPPAS